MRNLSLMFPHLTSWFKSILSMASHSFESDSGEQASTTDDVESSQWTTDLDDDSEACDRNGKEETDSDDSSEGGCKPQNNVASRKRLSKSNGKKVDPETSEKTQVQSDTETRNLLDDVGEDFDEDYLDLQEAGSLNAVDNQPQHVQIDAKLFELSSEQNDYYSKCFLYLLDKTQGSPSLTGALNGSDGRLLEFFRKSQLDNATLSRIWALADVNEDGFLNLSEFIVAMHLIVLHTKGNVPIPSRLPTPTRPLITPTRHLIRLENGCFTTSTAHYSTSTSSNTTNLSSDSTSRSSHSNQSQRVQQPNKNWDFVNGHKNVDETDALNKPSSCQTSANNNNCSGGHKQHSLSDDHLHVYAANREVVVAKFSDVPPVLVDSQPTALNATTSSVVLPSSGLAYAFPSVASRGPPPQPPLRKYTDSNSKGHGRSASLDLKTFVSLSSYPPPKSPHLNARLHPEEQNRSGATSNPDPNHLLSNELFLREQTHADIVMQNRGTQTDIISIDEALCGFSSHDAQPYSTSEKERKLRLRKLNEELENERIKLAQVRLQLELRIDEAQQQLKSLNPALPTKPTVL